MTAQQRSTGVPPMRDATLVACIVSRRQPPGSGPRFPYPIGSAVPGVG